MKCKHCLEDIAEGAKRCPKCHGDLRRSGIWSWIAKGALAGVGVFGAAVITSSIVPGVSAELDHDRTLREERLRIAHNIIEQGTRVEIDINNLRTMLTLFLKDSVAMSPRELHAAQQSTRAVVASRYLEFERVAWWWFRKVQRDARFPEPIEDWKARELDRLCEQYSKTIEASTKALNVIWTALLRDPSSRDRVARQTKLLDEQSKLLERLGEQRRDLFLRMANLFELPQPRRWFVFWRSHTTSLPI